MYQCDFCSRTFTSTKNRKIHQCWCENNAANTNSSREKLKTNRPKFLSQQHRDHLRDTVNAKIKNSDWHNSFSKCRKHEYEGEKFDGMWEVHLAKWFDENNVEWVRNKEQFPYVYDKQRQYTPDFYLPVIDCYVEVKGWKTSKDEAKWSQFQKHLLVLSGSDLQALGLPISVRKDWKK